MEAGGEMPPVELYKLGFGYYVLDGHHRVAVAHMLDAADIDAEITEFVPIADPEAARTFAERRAFERSTGLTDVGAAHPESYRAAQRDDRGVPDRGGRPGLSRRLPALVRAGSTARCGS